MNLHELNIIELRKLARSEYGINGKIESIPKADLIEIMEARNLTVNGKVEIKNESMAVVDHVYYRLLGYGQQFTEADEIADAILVKQI